MSNWQNYLDWYDLLVNQISGSETIFMFLSFAVIAFFCIKTKMHNVVALTMLALWALMMSTYFQNILPITIFLIGAFFYWGLIRMIRD